MPKQAFKLYFPCFINNTFLARSLGPEYVIFKWIFRRDEIEKKQRGKELKRSKPWQIVFITFLAWLHIFLKVEVKNEYFAIRDTDYNSYNQVRG